MKTKMIAVAVVVCLAGAAICLADDANIGSWKLNEAKSKFSPGAPKHTTVVYEAVGDSVKVTVDGMDSEGKPVHNEWTGKYDGKDYPLTGDSNADSRSYKRINDHNLELANKKDGKVTSTARVTVSADGKTRTVKASGTDAKGGKISSTAVYDRQ